MPEGPLSRNATNHERPGAGNRRTRLGLALLVALLTACSPSDARLPIRIEEPLTVDTYPPNIAGHPEAKSAAQQAGSDEKELLLATFGAGCFWCVEAVFQQLNGVVSVQSGYTGGDVDHPTYEQVCQGDTGHAEVCQIQFDPAVISYDDLLEVFWKTHDPTTLNRQGADVGTQYRSVIFYHDDHQKQLAEKRKRQLDQAGLWSAPIVTEISPANRFFAAEDYHQNYYINNPAKGYCQAVIRPKLDKFRQVFGDKLNTEDSGL
jgi:peptide-methionine (S)-S-oxide reductase